MDYHAADNKDNFSSSFSIYLALFSCIIILARIPKIILNRSGENTYSCLIYFSEKTFGLSTIKHDVKYGLYR